MGIKGVKRKDDSKWKRVAIFLVLLLIFGVLLNSARKVYKKKEAAEEALVRMEKEVSELKKRDEFLKDSLEKLATDEGIGFEIRKRLNVAEVGESVAIIVEEEQTTSSPSNSETSAWQKLKDFFVELFK